MKKAIAVVSFGTSYRETRIKTIQACEERIQAQFPQEMVYSAYTSGMVRKKIERLEGIRIPSVAELLLELLETGIQEVFIQPLHIIPGSEYHKILTDSQPYIEQFKKLVVGDPLLVREEDFRHVAEELIAAYHTDSCEEVTLFMGHGSSHSSFTSYAAMDHFFQGSSLTLACVESYPDFEQIIANWKREGVVHRVRLVPFMLVAGDHAQNDLAGEEDSWASRLREEGFEVEIDLTGLGERPWIQNLFVEHIQRRRKG
ncbi:sirohydrochlorin cobaltochelatase [Streptococcus danieliae]|uniref:Sirohydrochlorin cobaltochelatase n=1 Tax=Streptococcus danieliae TaxID=747656 RepID=A0A7X3G6N8_9STRE|nr:sirohydrochlorin cobaltochelatase [Streptococcus danieliae]MBF0698464.1 sirohydrochlorin cobaltochelatase [Streptococcus danieliae]MVX58095.1 sirohydrochlorin cobaltochelatase [Streptococcus danieliae]NYS95641.1 sirohydrochlorin cobaltochelatase [Streptococcus danieliae]